MTDLGRSLSRMAPSGNLSTYWRPHAVASRTERVRETVAVRDRSLHRIVPHRCRSGFREANSRKKKSRSGGAIHRSGTLERHPLMRCRQSRLKRSGPRRRQPPVRRGKPPDLPSDHRRLAHPKWRFQPQADSRSRGASTAPVPAAPVRRRKGSGTVVMTIVMLGAARWLKRWSAF